MAIDAIEIFRPDKLTIRQIFDGSNYYKIPDYQRPYSWEAEQVEQLWDDLYSAFEAKETGYFLGSTIFIKTKEFLDVVDGQQRLTSLIILFCVLRDLYFNRSNSKITLTDQDNPLVNIIRNAIYSEVDGKYRIRLITQLDNQSQFEDEILKKVNIPRIMPKNISNYMNTANIFIKKIENLIWFNDGSDKLKAFVNYIFKNVVIITITCSNEDYAIKLFQVLNTRGLELSSSDLIKSHLYSKINDHDEIKRNQFINVWIQIEEISKQLDEKTDDLFTYYEYYLIGKNPEKSLYEELKSQFKNKDSNEIIYDFKKFIEYFRDITIKQSKVIYSFKYLPNQVFWKTILTTAKQNSFPEFDNLYNILRNTYYCYWIADYTTSKIKQLSFNIITWIKNGIPIEGIKKNIDTKMREDNVIRKIKENLEDDVYNKPWLKPLLCLIEYYQIDDSKISLIDTNNKNLHIEHILLQEWRKTLGWQKTWKNEEGDLWINKLGNLTLLSMKKNIRASNDPFDKKKQIYGRYKEDGITAFEITKMISEKSIWSVNETKERQQWYIKEIQKILDIDLSQISELKPIDLSFFL